MKRNKLKISKTGQSLTTAITVGIIAASLLSVLLTGLLSSIVLNGRLGENSIRAVIFLVRALSVLIGTLTAAAIWREKPLPLVGFIALGYLLVLLGGGIVFYDGSFKHFISGVGSVLLGGLAALLILQRPKKRRLPTKYSL